MFSGICAELNETVSGIVSTSRCLTASKEKDLGKARDRVDLKLKHISDTQRALETKLDEVNGYEVRISVSQKSHWLSNHVCQPAVDHKVYSSVSCLSASS